MNPYILGVAIYIDKNTIGGVSISCERETVLKPFIYIELKNTFIPNNHQCSSIDTALITMLDITKAT